MKDLNFLTDANFATEIRTSFGANIDGNIMIQFCEKACNGLIYHVPNRALTFDVAGHPGGIPLNYFYETWNAIMQNRTIVDSAWVSTDFLDMTLTMGILIGILLSITIYLLLFKPRNRGKKT